MKGMKMGRKEVNPYLFADNMILYIEKNFQSYRLLEYMNLLESLLTKRSQYKTNNYSKAKLLKNEILKIPTVHKKHEKYKTLWNESNKRGARLLD